MLHGRPTLESVAYSGVKGRARLVRFDQRRGSNGQLVLVTGPNGSGKTTLLQALQLGLLGYEPVSGKQAAAGFRSDESMRVAIRFGDGFFVQRTWKGEKQTASAPDASGVREVDAAVLAKLGRMATVLDVNAWHALTPREKFESLLRASKEEGTVASLLGAEGEAMRLALMRSGFVETGNTAADVRTAAAMIEDMGKERKAESDAAGAELDRLPGDTLHWDAERDRELKDALDAANRESTEAVRGLNRLRRESEQAGAWRLRLVDINDRRKKIELELQLLARRKETAQGARQRALRASEALAAAEVADPPISRAEADSAFRAASDAVTAADDALHGAMEARDAQDNTAQTALRNAKLVCDSALQDPEVEQKARFNVVRGFVEEALAALPDDKALDALVEKRRRELADAERKKKDADAEAARVYGLQQKRNERLADVRNALAAAQCEASRCVSDSDDFFARREKELRDEDAELARREAEAPSPVPTGALEDAERREKAAVEAFNEARRARDAYADVARGVDERKRLTEQRDRLAQLADHYRGTARVLRERAKALIERAMAPVAEASRKILRPLNPAYDVQLVDGQWHAVQKDGRLVPWRMLSGGERVVFDAALMAALFEAFGAPWRPYLMDATALDEANLQAVLEHGAALAEAFDFVLLTTCHPPGYAPPPWQVVEMEAAADAG